MIKERPCREPQLREQWQCRTVHPKMMTGEDMDAGELRRERSHQSGPYDAAQLVVPSTRVSHDKRISLIQQVNSGAPAAPAVDTGTAAFRYNRTMHLFASHVRVRLVVVLVLAAAAAACGDSPTSPSATPPFSQSDLRVGTGDEAASGRVLTVNYTGWLYDPSRTDDKGAQFDTSTGREPFSFTLGIGQVISGWDRGLPGMKVGGLRRLVIPPSLGYGSFRNGPIPPNAALVFEVELLGVR